ncbi:MAG TPA: hypothetical protein VKA46_13400 [Gemmataceae bacterium]|nr:hypothetical protein [Gemmataceae bacterium]
MPEPAHDSAETQRLLEQARAGTAGAVDRLLERHRAYVCRFVELRLDPQLRARVDPSDVVQEAQMEAVRRLDARRKGDEKKTKRGRSSFSAGRSGGGTFSLTAAVCRG